MRGFSAGDLDTDVTGPSITLSERMGARYGITVRNPGPAEEPVPPEPYLMPPVRQMGPAVVPAIAHTPLGAMMPGPALPPPQIGGYDGAFPLNEDHGDFAVGVLDSWPEGSPVPFVS